MKVKTRKYRPARPFVEKLLKNKELRVHYEEEKARTRIAMLVKKLRQHAGLTQIQLAKKIKTSQSVIARLEGGNDSRMPSLPMLAHIAEACGAALEFGFQYKKAA